MRARVRVRARVGAGVREPQSGMPSARLEAAVVIAVFITPSEIT